MISIIWLVELFYNAYTQYNIYLMYYYETLLTFNLPHWSFTAPINWFILERQHNLLDLLVSACGLIVGINGCWTMTSSVIQKTGKNPIDLNVYYYGMIIWLCLYSHTVIHKYQCALAHTHAEACTNSNKTMIHERYESFILTHTHTNRRTHTVFMFLRPVAHWGTNTGTGYLLFLWLIY